MEQQRLFAIPDYCINHKEAESLAAGAYVLGSLGKLGEFAYRLNTNAEDAEACSKLMNQLHMFSDMVVYTPSSAFYRRVCDHSDSCLFADITLRMLNTGMPVRIITGLVEHSLSKKLLDYTQGIQSMGATLIFMEKTYPQTASYDELVTAKEIESSFNRGQKEVVVGRLAVITPLARDVAKEKGISILIQGG